jgi:hypothetical protein
MEHKRLIFSICAGVLLMGCTTDDDAAPTITTPVVQTSAATGVYGQFLTTAARNPVLPKQKADIQKTLKDVRA